MSFLLPSFIPAQFVLHVEINDQCDEGQHKEEDYTVSGLLSLTPQ